MVTATNSTNSHGLTNCLAGSLCGGPSAVGPFGPISLNGTFACFTTTTRRLLTADCRLATASCHIFRNVSFHFFLFSLLFLCRSSPLPRHFLHVFAVFNYLWFVDAFALKLPKYCQAKAKATATAKAWLRCSAVPAQPDNQIAKAKYCNGQSCSWPSIWVNPTSRPSPAHSAMADHLSAHQVSLTLFM